MVSLGLPGREDTDGESAVRRPPLKAYLTTNRIRIAMTNAIRPRSSAAAKPMNRRPCWPSAAPGLRNAPSRNEPKTLPTPSAAMPTPMAARPAPITFADARSMIVFPSSYSLDLVEIDGVVEIQRRQKRKHIGLDR